MTHPKPTRRDALKVLAALPLAAISGTTTAAKPMPPATGDALSLAAITANAVARRPVRLYAITNSTLPPIQCPHRPAEPGTMVGCPLLWLAENQSIVELTEHPLLDAAGTVTSWLGPHDDALLRIRTAALDLQLHGRAYWFAKQGRFGVPQSFWALEAHKVMEIKAHGERPASFEYDIQLCPDGKGASCIRFTEKSIVRFRRLSLANPRGLSPIVPPKDLESPKASTWDIERLANEYGVPIAMLHPEGMSRKAMEIAKVQHERNAVDPLCRSISASLTKWTRVQPVAKKRGWDRLFWGFDLSDDQITRSREEKP